MPKDLGIPFRIGRADPLIVVRGLVNGEGPVNLIIDTGASHTIITPAVARSAGLTLDQAKAKAFGAFGHADARIARVSTLSFGQVTVRDFDVAVVSLASLNRQTRLKIGGIVGFNFLRRFRVGIDYRTKRIFLHPY